MSETPREKTERSICDGYGGDTYRRVFTGDRAQCGCEWVRHPNFGDVLRLCPMHEAHRLRRG